MNAVVRALTQPRVWSRPTLLSQKTWMVWVLAALLLLSALSVVFVKDKYRRSYFNYQSAVHQNETLAVDHNRLLLESATRLAQGRLAAIAKAQNMVVPNDKQTIWLHDDS